jgi:hypothetical protein
LISLLIVDHQSSAGTSVPTDECALSATGDATGSYHRYDFHLGSNFLITVPECLAGCLLHEHERVQFIRTAFDAALRLRSNEMLPGCPRFITTGITGGSGEEVYLPADLDGSILLPLERPRLSWNFRAEARIGLSTSRRF